MEIKTIGRLAYVVKGIVKDCPYADFNAQAADLEKIAASNKPLAWFAFTVDNEEEHIYAHKFNTIAVWRRVGQSGIPELVKVELLKAYENPEFMGVRLDYWPEGEVYWLHYFWQEKDTGLRTTQNVLLGKAGGAVRWYEYD